MGKAMGNHLLQEMHCKEKKQSEEEWEGSDWKRLQRRINQSMGLVSITSQTNYNKYWENWGNLYIACILDDIWEFLLVILLKIIIIFNELIIFKDSKLFNDYITWCLEFASK